MDAQTFATKWRDQQDRKSRQHAQLRLAAETEARRMARLLADEYGARRVYAFGSLVREGRFHGRSDIDLAVEGMPPEHYLRALGRLLRESQFSIDLVELEDCPEHLRSRIATEGHVLVEA